MRLAVTTKFKIKNCVATPSGWLCSTGGAMFEIGFLNSDNSHA